MSTATLVEQFAAWEAEAGLPPLTGPEQVAEHLVHLVHRGVDWDVWSGARRVRYWDAFTDRVRAATYAGPTLSEWWQTLSAQITSTPRSAEDRALVAALLAHQDQRAVLTALHKHAATLVLRCRVVAETRRAAREDSTDHQEAS